jgi:chromosome partitioning protein
VGQVLAVVSQKGGVGKTTTAINLAAALARRGTKTLLIDADPQGSVRYGLGLNAATTRVGLSDFLAGTHEMHQVVRTTNLPWLRVVSAGSVSESATHETYLRDLAESPRTAELFDRARERGYVVIVDTPPGLGPVVHRVLACSQHVLIPLQCEPLALQTTTQILRGIRAALGDNPSLILEGILLTMVEPGNPASERVAAYVREQLPKGLVLDMVVPRTPASIDAFAAGQPLVLRAPNDEAARAYRALAEHLAGRLEWFHVSPASQKFPGSFAPSRQRRASICRRRKARRPPCRYRSCRRCSWCAAISCATASGIRPSLRF